ncbi:hypothetical protein POTOM_014720 [Populus tomentosa]|uniref:15-cis-phytoene synthase n=1 Tax=Populus tomentosa TaxID=118781 RepID=A0A8X8D8H9_POPTO|nr:hypothetical protein POTOM_014720 [Populus tomentosa]
MCSTFSLSAKPCAGAHIGKFLHSKSLVTRAKAEAITAPKRSSGHAFPQLLKQGIPHTDLQVHEIVERQSQANVLGKQDTCRKSEFHPMFLEEAYGRCRNICAEYAKTFYLGTLLMTEERQKAIWAIYVCCRGADELVDGPNAVHMSTAVLDMWEERLQDIFDGFPYDMLDAALTDTISKFCLDIKPFRDMIEGMRMDTRKFRYDNFPELYMYCYYVAGTVGLMSVPVMGIAAESSVSALSIYNAALALRGRVYLPQDELAQFGLCDKDVFARKVWSSLLIYRKILDAIEDNGYGNFTKRAFVGRTKKLLTLPLACSKAQPMSSLIFQ